MSLIGLPAIIEELLLVSAVLFMSSLIYKFMIKREDMREVKSKMKEKQDRIKELQKTNPKEATQVLNEMMKLQHKQMKMTMKPMMITMVISLVAIFPFLPNLYSGAVVYLPFSLPYFGNDFGWLAWYFIVSLPLNSIMRKILGVEL